ncbi:MAG: alpha-amylase family glycosyl hydrolase [Oscillospiraceae bacterium]
MYQIFPTVLRATAPPPAQRGMEHHRRMGQTVHYHADWDEPVEWQANTPGGEYAPIDFYGGTLRGIADRLHYLQKLGVTVLYLNPIFESASNHRYDTGDYRKVDPILGTNTDFKSSARPRRTAASASCSTVCSPTQGPTAGTSTASALSRLRRLQQPQLRLCALVQLHALPGRLQMLVGF